MEPAKPVHMDSDFQVKEWAYGEEAFRLSGELPCKMTAFTNSLLQAPDGPKPWRAGAAGGAAGGPYLSAMRIIGITGTNGAGKGTIVAYLLERHGFAHQSVRAYLYEHLDQMGLPRDRDHLVAQANALRAERGPAALAEILFERASASGQDSIIESIRTPGEIEALSAKGPFLLLAVDAPVRTRWERIRQRGSATDLVDFERFRANEEREMHTDDPNKQNLRACMDRAHMLLDNSGSFEDLYRQVDQVLLQWPVEKTASEGSSGRSSGAAAENPA